VGNVYWIDAWGGPMAAKHSVGGAGLVKEAVRHGEVWRLFTAALLHGSFEHFLFNAAALFGLGRMAEALAGRWRMAAVFGVSALLGNVFSFLAAPRGVSVGASGGLLGLVGFLMVVGYRRKTLLPPGFLRVFGINLALVVVMGVVARSMVDNAAHFGGFAAGTILGAFMAPPHGGLPLPDSGRARLAGVVVFGVVLASAAMAIVKTLWT
jgi:membrane associated rhomboid family serine protease